MHTDKHTPVSLSPYRKGVCWYGLRSKKGEPLRFCGAGAGEYQVSKRRGWAQRGTLQWEETTVPRIEAVWLCRSHASALEDRGYVVTSVTA